MLALTATAAMLLSDSKMNNVVNGFYSDEEFTSLGGDISYWGLHTISLPQLQRGVTLIPS